MDSILDSGWPWVRYLVIEILERMSRASSLLVISWEELVVSTARDESWDSSDSVRLQDLEEDWGRWSQSQNSGFLEKKLSAKSAIQTPLQAAREGRAAAGSCHTFKENSPKNSRKNALCVQEEEDIHQGCLANQGTS